MLVLKDQSGATRAGSVNSLHSGDEGHKKNNANNGVQFRQLFFLPVDLKTLQEGINNFIL